MERRQFLHSAGLGVAAAAVTAAPVAVAQSNANKETTMTDQTKAYSPLTSDNAALVLVVHQVGLLMCVGDL